MRVTVADVAFVAPIRSRGLKVELLRPRHVNFEPGSSEMESRTNNPLQPANLASAPRCGARTRLGAQCQSPAVRGRQRCRMHGGTNPGPPKGNRNAWKHGDRSAEAEEQLKILRAADRDLRILSKVRQGLELRCREKDRLIELQIAQRLIRSRTRLSRK
jgi:glucans biosynthesis protein